MNRRRASDNGVMRPGHWIALCAIWQVTVLVTAGMTWIVAHQPEPAPQIISLAELLPQRSGVSGGEAEVPAQVERALDALREDNGALYARVMHLQREHNALSREYLRLGFRNALDTAVSAPAAVRDGRARMPRAASIPNDVGRRGEWQGRTGARDSIAAGVGGALDAFDQSGLYALIDRALPTGEAGVAARLDAASPARARGGGAGMGNLEGLLQLRELEPLLELLVTLQSQGAGAGGGLGALGGDTGMLGALQGIGDRRGENTALDRDRRLLPALLFLALLHDGEDPPPEG